MVARFVRRKLNAPGAFILGLSPPSDNDANFEIESGHGPLLSFAAARTRLTMARP